MRRDDTVRLRHMLDAAREAMSFARDRTRAGLGSDRQLVLSLDDRWSQLFPQKQDEGLLQRQIIPVK